MLRHPSVLLEIMAVDSTCEINRPISQIPYCTCSISRSALFRTECSDWNIVGYETGAVWDLWIRSIVGMRQVEQHWCYLNNNEQINFHKHHFIRTIYCTYHCNQLIHGVSDNSICQSYSQLYKSYFRADFRLAPSQWGTSLQSNAVSHWLGANLESALAFGA